VNAKHLGKGLDTPCKFERVTFKIKDLPKGGSQAVNVERDPKYELVEGKCVRWIKEKGIGNLRANDGAQSVFVGKYNLLDGMECLEPGDIVKFAVGFNPKNKKEVAVRVSKLGHDGKWNVTKGPQKGFIKFHDAKKGCGQIVWSSGDRDVFFHSKDAPSDIAGGDEVQFKIANDGEDRKKAIKIKMIGDRKRIRGVCTDWDDEKGFGFLWVGGERVFVHYRNLNGDLTNLQEGDTVELEVNVNLNKGGKMAVRVHKIDDVDSKDRKKRKLRKKSSDDEEDEPPTKKRRTR